MKIENITSNEILDSKGFPTLETRVVLEDASTGTAAVPSGASTGTHEAHELRDGDPARYDGKGVLKAVQNVNELIFAHLKSKDFENQKNLDDTLISLDGTPDKSKLGANAILSVSMAYCRAVSQSKNIELYKYLGEISGQQELDLPTMNVLVIEGGSHGEWATDIQEYLIIPSKQRFSSINEAVEATKNVLKHIGGILNNKGYTTSLGMEGGFAPKELESNKEPFEIIMEGIEKAGYKPSDEISIGIDLAASEFFENGKYLLIREGRELSQDEWIEYILELIKPFPVSYIEDPISEDEWEGWNEMMSFVGNKKMIVGDDLLTTNVDRINQGIKSRSANSVIIKPNQIGTVSETIDAINLSEGSGFSTVISHRSGETEDTFIADLVAGTKSSQTKFGAPTQKERRVKYERLAEIYGN